jgi:hypothetical protein
MSILSRARNADSGVFRGSLKSVGFLARTMTDHVCNLALGLYAFPAQAQTLPDLFKKLQKKKVIFQKSCNRRK